jgi:ketosteroid isomerase-like protein
VTRRRSFVTILATASIVLAGLGTGPLPRTAAEEVESRVRQCGEAWARSDLATLDRLLADRAVPADPLGTERLADWRGGAAEQPRNVAITFDDLRVRVAGGVAVVTGSNTITSTTPERAEARRFTQVWVKRGTAWVRTAVRDVPAVRDVLAVRAAGEAAPEAPARSATLALLN